MVTNDPPTNTSSHSLFAFIRLLSRSNKLRLFDSIRIRQFILTILIVVGAFLRLHNLTFDAPLWFHPDERTIPAAIVDISFPDHPFSKLFTYGSFPVYLNYFILIFLKKIFTATDPFTLALITGRIESALLSTALIPLTYWITSRYLTSTPPSPPSRESTFSQKSLSPTQLRTNAKTRPSPFILLPSTLNLLALIAALLTTFCVGFIQFAHFGTYEIWLTFQSLVLLVLALKIINSPRLLSLLTVTGLFWGLSVGTKINQLVFAPGILLALYLRHLQASTPATRRFIPMLKSQFISLLKTAFHFIIVLNLTLTVWLLTNPHLLADQSKFFSMLNYEGGLARGTIITFYTRQFIGTLPLLFQATHVFPFILSWPVFLLGSIGLIIMFLTGVRHLVQYLSPHPPRHFPLILNSYSLILIFVPLWALLQLGTIGTLYVKWTRYVIPILPYFILATAWLLHQLYHKPNSRHSERGHDLAKNPYKSLTLYYPIVTIIILTQLLWALAFFSIYTHQDPRYAAADWADQHLDPHAYTLSEVYDMGITAFSPALNNIHLFNFYELDDPGWHQQRARELQQYLQKTQVIIVNSRRVWKSALDHPDQFPEAAKFYTQLFDGSLGYQKVADFTNFPRLGPLVFNTELTAEETFSVFDHPHVMIFEKKNR